MGQHYFPSDDSMTSTPIMKLSPSENRSITNNTFTVIGFDTVEFQEGSIEDNVGAATGNIGFTEAGWYCAIFNIYWQDGNDGTKRIGLITLYGDDDVQIASYAKATKSALENSADTLVATFHANPGEYVLARVKHTDGGNLNFSLLQNGFTVFLIRRG